MQIRSVWSAKKKKMGAKLKILIYTLYMRFRKLIISKHRPFRVMFYVNNLSMWKSDRLLLLLKEDNRFEPFVVSHLYLKDTDQMRMEIDKDLSNHFGALGIHFEKGFDYEKKELYPVSRFTPDMVFYPQPYIDTLRLIPKGVLLSYIPYCFEMEDYPLFYNSMYQNICWKLFVPTKIQKDLKTKYNYNHGANIVVSGNPLADYFFDGHTPSDNIWPINNKTVKRFIWAPHHSILPDDWLDYSNFLEIADMMVDIARKYCDKAQFIFKPHPMLREKLYRVWGIERTDAYFGIWKDMPNTNYANNNYVDLFMTSDALIHDCSSFTAEYLYVNKPVMYLTGKEKIETFNSFADQCFQVHYHGNTIPEIESFIENVIDGIDPLAEKRTEFIKENLIPKEGDTVAETIYKELCKIFD